MNRIKSLWDIHFEEEYGNDIDRTTFDRSKLITNTVENLLKDHSDLVIEVESGVKDRSELDSKIMELVNMQKINVSDKDELVRGILDYLFYYGQLQSLIEDEDISDIDFTAYNYGVIKRNGVKELLTSEYLFASEKDFNAFAKTLIIRNKGIINENYSHERVSDEKHRLRINVAIPPRNLKYTSMNIRKHRQNPYQVDDLVNLGMITDNQAHFLKGLIRDRKKILLAGKGAAGKTTLLRALMMTADPLDTYLVAEKDTELYLSQRNFIQQRIKKENHGGITVTLGDLVKDGLTMSLDGYVIGEIVGDEAWHFVSAGVTDHMVAGTIHAESASDAPKRLLSMIETYNPGPKAETVLGLISRSIDYIIHLTNFKVDEIAEVGEYNFEKNTVSVKTIEV